jgi:chromosome segregation ATPase
MIINNDKLLKLLKEKDEIVQAGRDISKQLEGMDKVLADYEKQEAEITEKVKCEELEAQKKEIIEQMIEAKKKFDDLEKQIRETKIAAIPKDLADKHYALMDEKEKLERERNKLALKVQKIKDRATPIIRKEVMPHLKEFEDIETAKAVRGKVIVTTFNHQEEFMKAWASRKQ